MGIFRRIGASLLLGLGILCTQYAQAQVYDDYIGSGHNNNISITTSDTNTGDSESLISGDGFFPDKAAASRFLGQATLGANFEDIEHLEQLGVQDWLEEQFNMPNGGSYAATYRELYDEAITRIANVHGAASVDSTRDRAQMQYAFYQKMMDDDDALRQKTAHALSQIFVISIADGGLNTRGFGVSSYYDVLYNNAFGNFRDLLGQVTRHPIMGIYLSSFQNKQADVAAGTFPDENFAREIMQLFTIGLWELNNDGSRKLDAQGNYIPTYNNIDIQELAKVFTGFSGGDWDLLNKPENTGNPLVFWKGLNHYDLSVPMLMWEEFHDPGLKFLVDGSVILPGQTGEQDVDDALDALFNHPNVGPFISRRLIQQFVKSNPTPAYINRIATVFNSNKYGVRGDLKSVIRAILSDPEARDCSDLSDPTIGKLRQPLERWSRLFLAFDLDSPSGDFWFRDFNLLYDKVEQTILSSPTVFNFFSPFYAESSIIAPNGLVSPEFQILHSTSGINYINVIEDAIKVRPFKNRTLVDPLLPTFDIDSNDEPFLDFSDEELVYSSAGISALIDRLNIIVCAGQLSAGTKDIIVNHHDALINAGASFTPREAVQEALYFMMMSPDFMILK